MAALNVTPSQLRRALAAKQLPDGGRAPPRAPLVQLNVAASTDLRSLDGFKKLVIREQKRRADPAGRTSPTSSWGADEYDQDVRLLGSKGRCSWACGWLPSASAIDVIGDVNKEIERGAPPSCRPACRSWSPTISTAYIREAMSEVVQTLAETVVIVMVVIFLFLGLVSVSALVPVVAIPVSLIGGVFLMQAFGFTLNLLTLLAIVLSVRPGRRTTRSSVVENVERQHPRRAHARTTRPLLGRARASWSVRSSR